MTCVIHLEHSLIVSSLRSIVRRKTMWGVGERDAGSVTSGSCLIVWEPSSNADFVQYNAVLCCQGRHPVRFEMVSTGITT